MFVVQEQLVESQGVHQRMEEELNKVKQVSLTHSRSEQFRKRASEAEEDHVSSD